MKSSTKMQNIRIWYTKGMREQALWLNDFLKFIGVNSVINKLDAPNNVIESRKNEVGRYLDIIFNTGEQRNFINFANTIIVGERDNLYSNIPNEYYAYGIRLDFKDIRGFSKLVKMIIGTTENERDSKIDDSLTDLIGIFTENDNRLYLAIVTIQDLFYSRLKTYNTYNKELLLDSINVIDEQLRKLAASMYDRLTNYDIFAVTYMQNLINDGHIVARTRGGWDTLKLWHDAGYLVNCNYNYGEAYKLKFRIMHNQINLEQLPDELFNEMKDDVQPEYLDEARILMGDIYREYGYTSNGYVIRIPRKLEEYYEDIDFSKESNYSGIFKLGLIYGKDKDYKQAKKCFEQVKHLLKAIDKNERTIREQEILYKAHVESLRIDVEVYGKQENLIRNLINLKQTVTNNDMTDCITYKINKENADLLDEIVESKRRAIISLIDELL